MKRLSDQDVINWMATAALKTSVRGYFMLKDLTEIRAYTGLGQAAKMAGYTEFRGFPSKSSPNETQRNVWIGGSPTPEMVEAMKTNYYIYVKAADDKKRMAKAKRDADAAKLQAKVDEAAKAAEAVTDDAEVSESVDSLADIGDLFDSSVKGTDKGPLQVSDALLAENNIKLDQINAHLQTLIGIWTAQDRTQ